MIHKLWNIHVELVEVDLNEPFEVWLEWMFVQRRFGIHIEAELGAVSEQWILRSHIFILLTRSTSALLAFSFSTQSLFRSCKVCSSIPSSRKASRQLWITLLITSLYVFLVTCVDCAIIWKYIFIWHVTCKCWKCKKNDGFYELTVVILHRDPPKSTDRVLSGCHFWQGGRSDLLLVSKMAAW